MNLAMLAKHIPGKLYLGATKIAPELALGGGLICLGVAAYEIYKATKTSEPIVAEHKRRLADIQEAHEMAVDEETGERDDDIYSEADERKDIVITYATTGKKLAKHYGKALVVSGLGAGLVIFSHCLLRNRYMGALSLAASEAAMFGKYRENVVEDAGKEKDLEYMYGAKTEEVAYTYYDDEGNEQVGHELQTSADFTDADASDYGEFAIFFDASNPNFTKDQSHNRFFINSRISRVQDSFASRGYYRVEDCLKALELEPKNIYDVQSKLHKNAHRWGGIYHHDLPANHELNWINYDIVPGVSDDEPVMLIKFYPECNIEEPELTKFRPPKTKTA